VPLGGKVAGYVAGFFALALVGSGEALRLLPRFGGGAGAEVALVRGAMAGGAPAPSDPQPAEGEGADAGADPAADGAADAGADPAADAAAAVSGGVTADGKVVLNLATEEDLRRLPGVGPSKAKAILAVRAKLKRFRKVEDLLRVKGIGRRSLKRLRPLVLVDPP
jgi:competence protein ComEA